MKYVFLLVVLVTLMLSACDTTTNADQTSPTPTTIPLPMTVLGSSLRAFVARFGKAEQSQDQSDYYSIYPTTLFGRVYHLVVKDGNVYDITIKNLQNKNEDKKYCYAFLPNDSTLTETVYGVGDVYMSNFLSKKFSSALFTDVGDTTIGEDPLPATPGTLTISFETYAASSQATCHLFVGK